MKYALIILAVLFCACGTTYQSKQEDISVPYVPAPIHDTTLVFISVPSTAKSPCNCDSIVDAAIMLLGNQQIAKTTPRGDKYQITLKTVRDSLGEAVSENKRLKYLIYSTLDAQGSADSVKTNVKTFIGFTDSEMDLNWWRGFKWGTGGIIFVSVGGLFIYSVVRTKIRGTLS